MGKEQNEIIYRNIYNVLLSIYFSQCATWLKIALNRASYSSDTYSNTPPLLPRLLLLPRRDFLPGEKHSLVTM